MPWLAVRLLAEAETADALTDALIEAGALSVSCDDADAGTPLEDSQFAEPGLEPPRAWRHNVLTALIAQDGSAEVIVAVAAGACGLPPPRFSVSRVEEEDWVRSTQRQFTPARVADGIWIVPSWCVPPEADAVNITIDPGLAFGTGSHATTRLMLRWIARELKGGETLLDYGCGSGILAIAAARLGASKVIGVDIDPQAISTARENASTNGVAIEFALPDAAPETTSEIVVANILANPLVVLAPLIMKSCARRLALSGILEEQAADIFAAYEPWFDLEIPDREEGWILVAGTRR